MAGERITERVTFKPGQEKLTTIVQKMMYLSKRQENGWTIDSATVEISAPAPRRMGKGKANAEP